MGRLLILIILTLEWVVLFSATGFAQDRCSQVYSSFSSTFYFSKSAQEHIFRGEFHRDSATDHVLLRGGLHTWGGWQNLLAFNPHVRPLDATPRGNEASWYHSQTAPNGVIFLRLPPSLFTKKALETSLVSDINMQSGFLWKTLFPKEMTNTQIYHGVRSILDKPTQVIDKGWALLVTGTIDGPMGAIVTRVVLNKSTFQVVTAFPVFDQPRMVLKARTPISRNAVVGFATKARFFRDKIKDQESFDVWVQLIEVATRAVLPGRNKIEWSNLARESKEAMIEQFLFPEGASRPSIPRLDLALTMSRFNKLNYQGGDYTILASRLFSNALRDSDLSHQRKYEIAKNMIDGLLVTPNTINYDIFWTRVVVQTILRHKNEFQAEHFANLQNRVVESPGFWTLLFRMPRLGSNGQPAQALHLGNIFSYLGVQTATPNTLNSNLSRVQWLFIGRIYNEYQMGRMSEIEIFRQLFDNPRYRQGGIQESLVARTLVDYINAISQSAYFFKFPNSPHSKTFQREGYQDHTKSYEWKVARRDLIKGLDLLKEQNVDFEANAVLKHFDALMKTPPDFSTIREASVINQILGIPFPGRNMEGRHFIPILMLQKPSSGSPWRATPTTMVMTLRQDQ